MGRYPGPVTTAAPPAAPGAPVPTTSGPGLFISFEGGDGVGKTTQIRILADLLAAADVDHILTREPGGTELGVEIRRLLLHGGHVAPRAEALLYAADRAHHIATRVRPALERGAVVLADRYLDEMSGGQRQRAFVAMVLAQETPYMLLDEPLNNLDMVHSVAMMRRLRAAAHELERTVVVVMHDINMAAAWSDRIVAMREGRVVLQGTPEETMTRECLSEVFGMDVPVHEIDGRRIALVWG